MSAPHPAARPLSSSRKKPSSSCAPLITEEEREQRGGRAGRSFCHQILRQRADVAEHRPEHHAGRRRRRKADCDRPDLWKLSPAREQVRNTTAMLAMFRRLVLELQSFSSHVSATPISAPRPSESAVFQQRPGPGSRDDNPPRRSAWRPRYRRKWRTRPNRLHRRAQRYGSRKIRPAGPSHFYVRRTTISVAAGAVAGGDDCTRTMA